jgi:NSS family neurotransmitter:Na+ symporter
MAVGEAGESMKTRESFSRFGFIVAASGSAIGLGNIWKFPYITYANDGGSFVIVYLIAVALIGAPIMMAEMLIGRHTGKSPAGAFLDLGREVAGGRLWGLVGALGVAGGFVIFSYYSVVAGWTVYYFGQCAWWSLSGFTPEVASGLGDRFGAFLANGPLQVTFATAFLAVTMVVVLFGIKRGIERVTRVLMPILFSLLVIMCVVSIWSPGFGEAMRFLFHVGPVHRDAVLEAVGHAFFTLSLGMGALITYGSYISKEASIRRDAAVVCILDTVIAIMACIVMFSVIFSVSEAERATTFSKSAVILFTTLPRMLYGLPFGDIVAPVFYILVSFAALTSTVSLLEVVASYFIDQRGWSRTRAVLVSGLGILAVSVPVALSLGANRTLTTLAPLGERNAGLFSTLDFFASNWMLPVGGLAISVFVGWFLAVSVSRSELEIGGTEFRLFPVWRAMVRYVCPLAILWIVVAVIGGKAFN